MTEQQQHLAQVLEQQQQLINEINSLNAQINSKSELAIKPQGVAEYLQQVRVTLPEPEPETENPSSEE